MKATMLFKKLRQNADFNVGCFLNIASRVCVLAVFLDAGCTIAMFKKNYCLKYL